MAKAWRIGAIIILASAAVGCSADSPAVAEKTTTPVPTVSPLIVTTTAATTTTTTMPPIGVGRFPEYQIVHRQPLEGTGDLVVVLLDPTSYDALTDLDLYEVIVDVVELFPPVHVAHLIDSNEALPAVLAAEPTEEQAALMEEHYLARLESGIRIMYLGPFAASGGTVLGS